MQYRASASTISISTSRSSASASRPRPAIRCAPISPRRRRRCKGSQNLAGIADPVDRCADREDHRRRDARRPDHRLPRARPRDPRRPLLDSALVSSRRTGSPIGTCSAGRRQSRAMPAAFRRPGGTIADKAAKLEAGEQSAHRWRDRSDTKHADRDDRLHRPPHPVHDPDAVRDHAGVVRGGAVRARRAGRARDRAALRRRHRRDLAHLRARQGGDFGGARQPQGGRRSTPPTRNIAARRASIRNSSRAWRSSSASTSRPTSASS